MGQARQPDTQTGIDAKLVERLALGFEAVPWGTNELLEPDEVGGWLGGLEVPEVLALCAAGLLESKAGLVPAASVLRFLERHPEWFALRGTKQVEYLRAKLDVQASRAEGPVRGVA